MRHHSHLNTAKSIIASYTGAEPLSAFLKKFFAADKKYGSKDRKQIGALCYNYYRLGKAARDIPVEERILLATFLCERSLNDFLAFHKPDWNDKITVTVPEKLLIINYQLLINNIFPYATELNTGIDHEQFAVSFLQQPQLFLRIRPGKTDIVKKKLADAGIVFEMQGDDRLALPNSSKIDMILKIDEEVVIQDASSQKVLDFLKDPVTCPQPLPPSPTVGQSTKYSASVWDCCAASGGKSILAYDILQGNIQLTVSDIRESILANLKKRFIAAGIKGYHSLITDLSLEQPSTFNLQSSIIICDAPCTGSGTWSRTPEQLYFFKSSAITEFAALQKQIVSNAIPHLEKGGLFFYITCSVFKEENEAIVDFIKEKFPVQLQSMECLRGYEDRADSMFVAVFTKE